MVFCNKDDDLFFNGLINGHNPYFNRWFSAIQYLWCIGGVIMVTILILIDGFLQ